MILEARHDRNRDYPVCGGRIGEVDAIYGVPTRKENDDVPANTGPPGWIGTSRTRPERRCPYGTCERREHRTPASSWSASRLRHGYVRCLWRTVSRFNAGYAGYSKSESGG